MKIEHKKEGAMNMIKVTKEMPPLGEFVLAWADEWGWFLGWTCEVPGLDGIYWKRGYEHEDGRYIALVTHWARLPSNFSERV